MANATYTSDGKALEYTLPDDCKAEYIALIPQGANGKITLIKGTDYTASNGVIRFFRVPPAGASIVVSNEINSIITADTENDLSNEVRERKESAAVLKREIEELADAYRSVVDEGNINTASFAGLSEAAINNALTLSEIYERIRNLEHKS